MILIGIPTFNSAWSLKQVFKSIKNLTIDHKQLIILLVDNTSKDNTIAIIRRFIRKNREEFSGIATIQHPHLKGFSYKTYTKYSGNVNIINAMNIIRDYSMRHDLDTVILGSDCLMPPDAIQKLYQCDSDIAAGYTVTQLSHDQYVLPIFFYNKEKNIYEPWKKSFIGKKYHEIVLSSQERRSPPAECDGAGNGLMLIKKDVFWKVGWEESNTPGYDVLFCMKAKSKGFTVKFHPALFYDHLHYIYKVDESRKNFRIEIMGRRRTWY